MRTQTSWWRRGAAGIAGALCVGALVVIVLLATAAGGSGGGYVVHAIFDDAANITVGEDVKIDGVKVGTVQSLAPTPNAQAALNLRIDNPGFQDFRSDASCTIKPQALIGEKYVDCLPTQPRAVGAPLPPPLHKIPAGREGAGDLLLPVHNTSSPVDVDLLGDISRLPERQRLTIILNELGAGFAGRGEDLNAVIRRANPALQEFEKVLGIFASENKILGKLAVESDEALAPIAAEREHLTHFLAENNVVSTAMARHRGALAQNFQLLPAFLREFGPAMERLGKFAEQTTPVMTDLGIAAPGINKTFANAGPFATSSTKFFKSLGASAKTSGPALVGLQPLLGQVQTLGTAAKPFSTNFSTLLTSVRSTGGLERLLDFVFLGSNATNGYDALGHFLRAVAVAKNCIGYAVTPTGGCSANFANLTASTATARAASDGVSASTSVTMARTLAVLGGATPAQAIARYPAPATTSEGAGLGASATGQESTTNAKPVGGASAGTTYYSPSSESSGASGLLLNYLLGN